MLLIVKLLHKCIYLPYIKKCDLIQNTAHHGKKKPCQEVEYGYIFVIFLQNKSDYLTNIFNGTLLSKRTVTIDPNRKP